MNIGTLQFRISDNHTVDKLNPNCKINIPVGKSSWMKQWTNGALQYLTRALLCSLLLWELDCEADCVTRFSDKAVAYLVDSVAANENSIFTQKKGTGLHSNTYVYGSASFLIC